ncbi:MAG TPA: hypothetical protein VNC50_14585 [Planctomycetia bacterium]|nr:hypothetical protein [Planctomycetia bacterium]
MKTLIGDWIGNLVHVTLRTAVPTPVKGTLLEADPSGILLEMPKGKTFIPVTSILHVSLLAKT